MSTDWKWRALAITAWGISFATWIGVGLWLWLR